MSERYLVIGAGGHGKVVADTIRASNNAVTGFVDDNVNLVGTVICGVPVLGVVSSWMTHPHDCLVVAIGDNRIRRLTVDTVTASAVQAQWGIVVHPAAVIAPSVRIGPGTVVMAGVVINADTVIGEHVITNTGATIDHDCVVGSFVHVAPGVHLAGGVRVGTGVLVGIGASVIPGLEIGSNSVVGAGAVVVRSVPSNTTAIGVPAKW